MVNYLEYQEQSARDLRLNVVEGELNLSQFRVFKTATIRLAPHASVEAMIIGRSHVICFRVGPLKVYEVFACGEVEAERRRAYYGPLGDVQGSVELSFTNEVTYDFFATVERWPEGVSELAAMEAKTDARGFFLSYDFPQRDHSKAATTIILGSSDKQGAAIRIKTAHSYPNERMIVFSHSGLLIRKDSRIYDKEVHVASHNHSNGDGVLGDGLRGSASGAAEPSRSNS